VSFCRFGHPLYAHDTRYHQCAPTGILDAGQAQGAGPVLLTLQPHRIMTERQHKRARS
jgi:hypothetical protein